MKTLKEKIKYSLIAIDKIFPRQYNKFRIDKPLRQKKGRIGLSKRVDYGASSIKALCVIWTVEGCVKCADVGLALKAGV